MYTYICIYIYIYREREREVYVYIYIYIRMCTYNTYPIFQNNIFSDLARILTNSQNYD